MQNQQRVRHCFVEPFGKNADLKLIISTLEIYFLFFMNEFREGTYPVWRG